MVVVTSVIVGASVVVVAFVVVAVVASRVFDTSFVGGASRHNIPFSTTGCDFGGELCFRTTMFSDGASRGGFNP